MKIERLRLKGITRFDQPVDLDFSTLPPGLIAIVGGNGEGKTSILEAMFATWYGEMPSRSDRELVDLVEGRKDAYLDATVSLDGRGTYRGRMNIDGLARKRDAVLQRLDLDGWVTLNDGKISTFQDAVAGVLPGKATVLASAFAAQNKQGSFSTLDRKGRKTLFVQLLGLEQLEAHAETARAAAQLIERRRDALQAQVDVLRPMTRDEDADALGDEGNALTTKLACLDRDVALAIAAVAAAEQAVDVQRVRDTEAGAARQQAADLQQQRNEQAAALVRVEHAEDSAVAAYLRERDGITAKAQQATATAQAQLDILPSAEKLDAVLASTIATITAQCDVRRAETEGRITNNRRLLDEAATIRAAVVALEQLEGRIADAEAVLSARTRVTAEHVAVATDARRDANARSRAADDLERARAAAHLLTTVPFGDRCAEAGCAFVSQAAAAKAEIPTLEALVRDAVAAAQTADDAEAAWRQSQQDEAAARRGLEGLRDGLKAHNKTREHAARLQVATDRVTELEGDLAAIQASADADIVRAKDARVVRGHEVDADRERHQDAIADVENDRVVDLDALERRVQVIKATFAEQRDARLVAIRTLDDQVQALAPLLEQADAEAAELSGRQSALARARADLANEQQLAARLSAEIQGFERRRSEFKTRHDERLRLEATVRTVDTELIEWQALARVFGRDGLPVLEIDAAGPSVSALANDLLQACFSGRFSVELVTQEVKAGGKGLKEAFELKVWDAERGGDTRDLSDLSGGEQVIVDEALKCALALFVNSRNVQPLRTCWRDETTGALDPENAIRYVAMLRRARERGGFVHTIFISHNPEAAALADVQLVVENGGARFVYPPFDRTAAA